MGTVPIKLGNFKDDVNDGFFSWLCLAMSVCMIALFFGAAKTAIFSAFFLKI